MAQLKVKSCGACGGEFEPASNRQKCCKDCGRRGQSTCAACGVAFNLKANTTGKYCSRVCWQVGTALPGMEPRPCRACGKTFKPRGIRQVACSRECRVAIRTPKSRKCEVCGKEFTSKRGDQPTCSKACGGVRRRMGRTSRCERCGRELPFSNFRARRFCSDACRRDTIGHRKETNHGYVMVRVGKGVPGASERGWMLEHRHVMVGVLGRPLRKGEHVHHRNGNRADNRPENLELWQGKDPKGQRSVDLLIHEIEQLGDEDRARLLAHFRP